MDSRNSSSVPGTMDPVVEAAADGGASASHESGAGLGPLLKEPNRLLLGIGLAAGGRLDGAGCRDDAVFQHHAAHTDGRKNMRILFHNIHSPVKKLKNKERRGRNAE